MPRTARSFAAMTAFPAAFLLATPAMAQDQTARVDSIFAFATPATPGCAVGVSERGKVVVNRSYGLADVDGKRVLDERSLFDIGSTQKQFTAASVLLLVADGRLALDDDIRKYLPELPDYGRKITVDHLLTHTSGVRDWTGLLPFAPEGTAVLPLILRQRDLNFAPGTEWSYSSSGFELAKEIVARVSKTTFADFTRKRLFEPLGMTSSAYVPDILKAGEHAALGYQKEGAGWKPYMRLGNNRGGGAIVSTVSDMLRWQDALASGKLGRFVTGKLEEPARLANGRKLRYARGLMVDSTPGGKVISHSGGAAGFSTWMGHMPEHGLSVAVSCNFDPVSATALGGRVADVFLPPLTAEQRARGALRKGIEGVDVSERAGLFLDERTGDPLRLAAEGGRLTIAGGMPLVAESANTFRPRRADLFFLSQDDFTLSFPDADHVEMKSMEGQVTRYRRAQPWTPTAAELQALDGRYESKELGNVFELVPGENAVTMRFERSPEKAVPFTPVDRDMFMQRQMVVRVRRDASGKVAGFDFSNPVVRRIAFTRLGERTSSSVATAAAREPAPATPPAAAGASAPPLEPFVGDYEMAPGRSIAITLEGGRLHGQPTGAAKLPLTHVSGTTFSVENRPMTLTFTLGADGRPTAMVMRQNGNERTLTRVR